MKSKLSKLKKIFKVLFYIKKLFDSEHLRCPLDFVQELLLEKVHEIQQQDLSRLSSLFHEEGMKILRIHLYEKFFTHEF